MKKQSDLSRTFNTDRIGTLEGQQELYRVLSAIAYIKPNIGYCQGMNFVVGMLLNVTEDEELSFWIFLSLLENKDMEKMYYPGVPDLHIKNFQMGHLIGHYMPKLSKHLKEVQMTTDYFTSKWFMTLFACALHKRTILTIFDNFFLEGWKSIFKIGIAILMCIENDLLERDLQGLSSYLRDDIKVMDFNITELMINADKIEISETILYKLHEKFYINRADLKLKHEKEWDKDQRPALEWAREIFKKMEPHTKQDVQKFTEKIEKLDKELEGQTKSLNSARSEYRKTKDERELFDEKKNALTITLHSLQKDIALKKHKIVLTSRFQAKKMNSSFGEFTYTGETEEDDKVSINEIKQLNKEIKSIESRIEKMKYDHVQSTSYYKKLSESYHEKKIRFEEIKNYKESVQKQMNGFLIMYEINKEQILRELAGKLKHCKKYKDLHIF